MEIEQCKSVRKCFEEGHAVVMQEVKGCADFPLDGDGYLDPGHVVRYYRERMTYRDPRSGKTKVWTQADLAQRLGVSEVTVRLMETKNKGLDSIERRRLLADLLRIPPALLGLASFTEQHAATFIQADTQASTIKLYQSALSVYTTMHTTGTAQEVLPDIEGWVFRIQADLDQTKSAQQSSLLRVLWGFHTVCTKIYGEDTCDWSRAFDHVNASLEIASILQDTNMQASSLYRSSAVYVAQRNFALAKTAIDGAMIYAKKADPHIIGAVLVDAALVHGTTSVDMAGNIYVQKLLEQAEQYASTTIDDGVMNFGRGKYQLIKARTLLAVDRPGKALECLDEAEEGISVHEKRRLAFLDIMRADCYTKLKRPEYDTAVLLLMEAFDTSKTIKSSFNIKHIDRLYKILATSTYGTSPQVADLGLSLREWRQLKH